MNRIFSHQVFLTGLLVFGSCCLPTYACENGNPESTSYMRREDNRCEGIVRRRSGESSSGLFRIISLAIGTITSYSSDLTIKIPGVGSATPEIRVQSLSRIQSQSAVDLSVGRDLNLYNKQFWCRYPQP